MKIEVGDRVTGEFLDNNQIIEEIATSNDFLKRLYKNIENNKVKIIKIEKPNWEVVEQKKELLTEECFKAMISQPMNGKKEEQIRKEREKIVDKLQSIGWKVVDTIFAEEAPKDCDKALYYLSKSIEAIGKVDAVMFMNGGQNARGCKIEHEICQQYGKLIMYEYEL